MPDIQVDGGVVVAITGTAAEIAQFNDHNHMLACAELAGRISDAEHTVTFNDCLLFGKGRVDFRTLEMHYMHLISSLTAPRGTLEVDLRGARKLASKPHTLDAHIRLGDLIARRDELAQLIASYETSAGHNMANLRFGLEFIDFATAVVAMKSMVAAE